MRNNARSDYSPRLQFAVREARRIRRNLVRLRGETDLGGDCGLASVFLADAIGDVGSLRRTGDLTHVWNKVDGVIIDITATQFNDSLRSDAAGEPAVFGVLVTRTPRTYHVPITGRGRRVLSYLAEVDWYLGDARVHRRFLDAKKRLMQRAGPCRVCCGYGMEVDGTQPCTRCGRGGMSWTRVVELSSQQGN